MRARQQQSYHDPSPEPTQPPSSEPTQAPSLFVSKYIPNFFIKPYFMAHAKYWSWKRQRRRNWNCPPDLEDWHHVENWIPTVLLNDHTKPSGDKCYNINFPYYRDAFVFGIVLTPVSPLDDVLPMNEVNPPKVRIGGAPTTKPRLSPLALVFDSDANIYIFNNPSFLSGIITCLGRYINTTISITLCNKMGRLSDDLKSLSLPMTGFYFQPNGIGSIISLSLLSGTHRIVMNADVENAFYVFNRADGTYMKYTRCEISNLYTYVVVCMTYAGDPCDDDVLQLHNNDQIFITQILHHTLLTSSLRIKKGNVDNAITHYDVLWCKFRQIGIYNSTDFLDVGRRNVGSREAINSLLSNSDLPIL